MKTLFDCHTLMAVTLTILCGLLAIAGSLSATVIVSDNGGGTADMPLHVAYYSTSPMYIIDGLPAGTNIAIDAVHTAPTTTVEQAGGSLSSTQSAGIGTGFSWTMQGTGTLASRPAR